MKVVSTVGWISAVKQKSVAAKVASGAADVSSFQPNTVHYQLILSGYMNIKNISMNYLLKATVCGKMKISDWVFWEGDDLSEAPQLWLIEAAGVQTSQWIKLDQGDSDGVLWCQ